MAARTPRERKAAQLDRQRRGVALAVGVEFGPADIDNLVAVGLLADTEAGDPQAVGRAINIALDAFWRIIARLDDHGSPLAREVAARAFQDAADRAANSHRKNSRRELRRPLRAVS